MEIKVSLLLLGPSCPLQTILVSDLVGCGSPLQIVMAVWRTFFKFEARQTAIYSFQRRLFLMNLKVLVDDKQCLYVLRNHHKKEGEHKQIFS